MTLQGTADLLVAALDLNLVRLLRDAIRTADLSQSAPGGPGSLKQASRAVAEPAARFEPRPVVHPMPRFEPRPVIHPTPRVEPSPEPSCGCDPVTPSRRNNPIEPPWKKLAWEIPTSPPAQVKVLLRRTDVIHKGSLIDLFI